ncbi:ATP-binding cassette sub-family G member 1 [Caerostris extrusa]|uniref:ATP-binding cassette sub-family G member 1 n=1 Tax=Caerostris extrusa TaxID=172846 RepID=A0AAV4WW01_CAEEX|nr:ATP-binding cassette sub-family G member 1 [Caerostris extrusa]
MGRSSSSRRAWVSGGVSVNGAPRDMRVFRKLSCYIMQDDHLLPHLTVRESVRLAARLKVPDRVSPRTGRRRDCHTSSSYRPHIKFSSYLFVIPSSYHIFIIPLPLTVLISYLHHTSSPYRPHIISSSYHPRIISSSYLFALPSSYHIFIIPFLISYLHHTVLVSYLYHSSTPYSPHISSSYLFSIQSSYHNFILHLLHTIFSLYCPHNLHHTSSSYRPHIISSSYSLNAMFDCMSKTCHE